MQFTIARAIQVLERTPNVLRAQLDGLEEAWTTANEGPATWSAFDVVGHLIHGEETDWIPRARIILEQGEARTFVPFDRHAQFERSRGLRLAELLARFASLRAENLVVLRGWKLGERELGLRGRHPDFGPVTLRQLLAAWVVHDLGHLAQIARVLARQHTDEVGPWKAYLPVLTRPPA
jgi:hypothetical protein